MKFKNRNLRDLAEMVIGDNDKFPYRSSSYITQFFEECDLDFRHDGSTRWAWTSERLAELLNERQEAPNTLPPRFVHVLRVLMQKGDASEADPERLMALAELNKPLSREGFEAFYGDDKLLHVRHIGTQTLSIALSPHRPFTPDEMRKRQELTNYLDRCSQDDLIDNILLPLFRQLGFQRISPAGHKDKALEYGKDVWMRFVLPTLHVLYFGLQAKKGKLDAAGATKSGSANIAEIHNQALMMLGHEIFDSETSKKALVDHAFIVAGGEITKQAKNWLGEKLDASKRSKILFMDREDILNLYVVSGLALPEDAKPKRPRFLDDDIPF
jgi:hypothetical protein